MSKAARESPAEEVVRLREALRASERNSRLLVDSIPGLVALLTSAGGDESVRPQLLARGAAECLFKPFSETALIDALNTALRMG